MAFSVRPSGPSRSAGKSSSKADLTTQRHTDYNRPRKIITAPTPPVSWKLLSFTGDCSMQSTCTVTMVRKDTWGGCVAMCVRSEAQGSYRVGNKEQVCGRQGGAGAITGEAAEPRGPTQRLGQEQTEPGNKLVMDGLQAQLWVNTLLKRMQAPFH